MKPSSVLIGIETEYGLLVEGRGPQDQIQDSADFVRSYPGSCFIGWDYRFESPRADLRGFKLDHLAQDPVDAQFDRPGAPVQTSAEIRSDRVLSNGARFYNDHGHPEYATPECHSLAQLVALDHVGETVLRETAAAFGRPTKVYKNNTDFHGASYGCHESYLAPRELGFDRLFPAILPMLICRQILTGAGKVGSESGGWVDFQISQRADFFAEAANAETLYRRPIFNTRDEAHGDPSRFLRLHVISGDANMNPWSTWLKVGLIRLAVALTAVGEAPIWRIARPVETFRRISRDRERAYAVELEGGSHTNAYFVLDSYLAAAEKILDLDQEDRQLIQVSRELLVQLEQGLPGPERKIDWVAKQQLIESALEGEGWRTGYAQSLDLAYCDLDHEEGLFPALEESGAVDPFPFESPRAEGRARARAIAVSRFGAELQTVSWGSLVFAGADLAIPPNLPDDPDLINLETKEEFIQRLISLGAQNRV